MMVLTREHDTTNRGILPSTSTPLEKDLVGSASFNGFMDTAARAVGTMKLADIPEDALMWLLLEYGLTAYLQFKTDKRELLAEGMHLNRIRGTAEAVELVCRWVGFPNATVREAEYPGPQFSCFEIDLGRVPANSSEFCSLVAAVNTVKPLRSRFRRAFSGWDVRQLRLDEGASWGSCLSGYSGVILDRNGYRCGRPTKLIVSLGVTDTCQELDLFDDNELVSDSWLTREQEINCFRRGNIWPVLDRDWAKAFNDPFMRFIECMDAAEHVPTMYFREDTIYPTNVVLDENRSGFNIRRPSSDVWETGELAPIYRVREEVSGNDWTWQTLSEGLMFNNPYHGVDSWMEEVVV